MADYLTLRATEFSKQGAKFKKLHGSPESLYEQGYLLQRKYDGCAGILVKDEVGVTRMVSRTGEDYSASCQHIIEALDPILSVQTAVLGEVWHPDRAFPQISGQFRKRAESDLHFVIYDRVWASSLSRTIPLLRSYETYESRLGKVIQLAYRAAVPFIYPACAVHSTAYDLNLDARRLQDVYPDRYDGLILRDPNATYVPGLSKNGEIIKIKPVAAYDLEVQEVFLRPGAKTGRPVLTVAVELNGVKSEVGSGIPHDLTPRDLWGKIIEVECLGITADGKLREPRFKGIRHDKLQPDTEV